MTTNDVALQGLDDCTHAVSLPMHLLSRAAAHLISDGHGHHFVVINEGRSLGCSKMALECLQEAGLLDFDSLSETQTEAQFQILRQAILDEPDPDKRHELLVHLVKNNIAYKDGYRLLCEKDKTDPAGRWYFQVECDRPDIYTKEMGVGRGGKAYLSQHMIESELVRLAFGLFKAYDEHESREWFQYRGRSVFGPHMSIDALWEVADRFDFRESGS